jgi:hypothetical protein
MGEQSSLNSVFIGEIENPVSVLAGCIGPFPTFVGMGTLYLGKESGGSFRIESG